MIKDYKFLISSTNEAMCFEGEVVSMTIHSEKNSLMTVDFTMTIYKTRIANNKENLTHLIPFPEAPLLQGEVSWVRITGLTEVTAKVTKREGTFKASANVRGFFSSYEKACAAEVQSRMEGERQYE